MTVGLLDQRFCITVGLMDQRFCITVGLMDQRFYNPVGLMDQRFCITVGLLDQRFLPKLINLRISPKIFNIIHTINRSSVFSEVSALFIVDVLGIWKGIICAQTASDIMGHYPVMALQ